MISYKIGKLLIITEFLLFLIAFDVHATVITEDQLLALPQKVNHKDAVHLCQKHGMNLIKVQNEQTNEIVFNFAKIRGLGQYWMDGNDRQIEGQWVYEDGNRITYHKWQKGQPDNYNNEDCLHGSFYGNGFWNDIRCDIQNAVICYREIQKTDIETLSEDQLLALPNKVNHQKAVALCKEQGMNLIKITNEKSNELVLQFAAIRGLGQYWIDANDKLYEGQWMYEDGNLITYSKWNPGQPDNYLNEDCAHGLLNKGGFWNDIKCDVNHAMICYREKSEIKSVKIEENQLVVLPNKANYQEAVDFCKSKGLNLIKVQNEEINQMVFKFAVKNKLGQYWMDGSDRQTEGQWTYENGEKIIFSKWHPGQPDNYNNEDCLHGLFYQNGFWNDINCLIKNSVICYGDSSSTKITTETEVKPETKTVTETISIYLTQELTTYDEAIQYCKNQDLRLIRIESGELNKLVYEMAARKNLGTYWIDGNDRTEKGVWLDSDGNKLKYKNFKDGITNDSNDGHCINGFSFKNEQWNIVQCNSKNSVICL